MHPRMYQMLRGPMITFAPNDDSGHNDDDNQDQDDGAGDDDAGNNDDNSGQDDDQGQDDKGSKNKPTDAEARLLKDAMKHKKAANAAKEALAAANKALEAFKGIDPAKIKALQDAQDAAERTAAEKRGEYDRIVAQMREQNEAKLAEVQTERAADKAQITTLQARIDELTVGTSFGNSKFLADVTVLTPAKARRLYGDHFDIEDGEVVAYDKPRGSKERTPLVDGDGDHLGFEAAIEKIIRADEDFDRIARSKTKQGSGSKGSDVKDEGDKKANEPTGVGRIAASLKASAKK